MRSDSLPPAQAVVGMIDRPDLTQVSEEPSKFETGEDAPPAPVGLLNNG
ncbi:MAG TPA: hypothetical protein P5016_19720 [Verrucomicrobiales bacterium]|nr:hypothetical protein [Verrucomicrobiales bacterium]